MRSPDCWVLARMAPPWRARRALKHSTPDGPRPQGFFHARFRRRSVPLAAAFPAGRWREIPRPWPIFTWGPFWQRRDGFPLNPPYHPGDLTRSNPPRPPQGARGFLSSQLDPRSLMTCWTRSGAKPSRSGPRSWSGTPWALAATRAVEVSDADGATGLHLGCPSLLSA